MRIEVQGEVFAVWRVCAGYFARRSRCDASGDTQCCRRDAPRLLVAQREPK